MLKREITTPPEHIYPSDPWRIVEARFPGDFAARAETIFALGNGYLGTRGTFEEGRPSLSPGTFLNGFHETWPIAHAEEAFGLASLGQTIVSVPDATVMKLYVDDEPLFLPTARLMEYERVLDMRTGVLTRDLLWSTAAGKHVRVRSRRMVSLAQRHVLAVSYEVTLLDRDAPVVVSSQVINREDLPADVEATPVAGDPRLAPSFAARVLHPEVEERLAMGALLGYRTAASKMTLAVGVDHQIETELEHNVELDVGSDRTELTVFTHAEPGVPLRLVKFATYQFSRSAPVAELVQRCGRTLRRTAHEGLAKLEESQHEQLDRFWSRADVQVKMASGGTDLQQAIRWNLFQVCQASWRAEGAGIPAKGLTGRAYEGHYFWDSEVYILPFLAYTEPRIARNLLRFRHSMLDKARERAKVMSQDGALFPWRTINGEEASAMFQSGTAQYHINAAIAYAVRRYVDVRGDVDFLAEVGVDLLVETARLWYDLGFYGEDGSFHIHSVTGPDEYTTVVNDNTYTNLMARMNLRYAASAVRLLGERLPAERARLDLELRCDEAELDRWCEAADAMYVPFDESRGINPQDDTFLTREVWDLANTPRDKFPLMLHYHPLVIYRFQVLKQADVVMAMFLLGNEFSLEQKRRNFEYYDPLTTGDSSLSASVESIVAAEVGAEDAATRNLLYAVVMDLADVQGNVSDGVHVASAAGVWMALVLGLGGVRDFDGQLSIDPHLPTTFESLCFPLRFQDRQMVVTLTHDEERIELVSGSPIEVTLRGEVRRVATDAPVAVARPGVVVPPAP